MFKNEEYSSFLNIFTKIRFTILLIYKFYIPISTFRVSYKATTLRIVPSKTANNALYIRSISTGIRDRYTCFHLA